MTAPCEGCARPEGGLYIASCRDCSLRHIARGPDYFASAAEGAPTERYRAQLAALGGKPSAIHKAVQATAENLKQLQGALL